MRTATWGAIVIGLVAVVGGVSHAMQPCGPLDRSGCVARIAISDMSNLGDTIAVAPDERGRIWIAGTRYKPRGGRSGGYDSFVDLVRLDLGSGSEVSRFSPSFTGHPVQLVVSDDGKRLAISLSILDSRSASLGVVTSTGDTVWADEIDELDIIPDAEGYAFDLAFGPGGALFAGPLAYDAGGEKAETRPVESRRIESSRAGVALPEGFIPWTRALVALSPEGDREAVLVRRFYGAGAAVRAILEVREKAGGRRIVRHEIETDLNAALAWDPLGRGVIVARAGEIAPGANTELRVYRAEAQP